MEPKEAKVIRRILRSKLILVIVAVAIVVGALTLAVYVKSSFFPRLLVNQDLRNDIEAVLLDYSESLSTGQISQETYYTPMMQDLVRERRRFYEEYFEVGLHSTLDSVKSEFVLGPDYPGVEISTLPNDQVSVKVTEKVTLYGRYCSPEESPTVQAAWWAILRTDDETVKQALEEYIRSIKEDVSKSSEDGFEITFIPRHYLVIAESKGGLQILEDTFTDRNSIDSPSGTDNVIWRDGQFYRSKPDLTKMPDYQIYATSIEELGRRLLEDYTEAYGE